MSSDPSRDLIGVWRHSREEDTETESVYRPEDYDFPPARGRTGYEFRANGTCDFLGISPRDGTARTGGRWELNEDPVPSIVMTFPGGRREVLLLVSVDNSRLVVSRTAGG